MKKPTLDEASKERAYLVRELIANLEILKPEGDQATLRHRLCQRLFIEIEAITHQQVLRLYEAMCKCDFPEQHTTALRDLLARRIGVFHHLKRVRTVVIEARKPGAAGTPVCPHN